MAQLDVFDGDVVLLVKPSATFAFAYMPERSDAGGGVLSLRHLPRFDLMAERGKS